MHQIIDMKDAIEVKHVPLSLDNSSWVKLIKLDFFSSSQIEEIRLFRWSHGCYIKNGHSAASYKKPFKYGTIELEARNQMPLLVEKLMKFCQEYNPQINQCLVNWYDWSDIYDLSMQNEDLDQLKQDSDIWNWTFQPTMRNLIFKSNDIYNVDHLGLDVKMNNNMSIIMGGKCLATHNRGLKLVCRGVLGEMIDISFRCYK